MKKLNILFFLVASIILNAQIITGKIFSNDENKAIPYAKIGVENSEIGAIANENGNFEIDLSKADPNGNLKVEVAGFQTYKQAVQDFVKTNPQTILLKGKIRDIAEVKIAPKKLVSRNWGVNTKSKSILYSVNPKLRKDEYLRETAVEFNTKKPAKIEKINLNIARFDSDKPVALRYTIYKQKGGMPGDIVDTGDILTELTAEKIINGTFSLDVKNRNIWVKDTFYVGIQFMNDFSGRIYISAAFFRAGFTRHFYGDWEKISIAAPAINIDVKVDKNYKNEIEDAWKNPDAEQEKKAIEAIYKLKNTWRNKNNH